MVQGGEGVAAEGRERLGEPVCRSEAMRRVFAMVDRVADADVPVLVRGESGVGKEIVARALHERSRRHDRPFVKVNCAALPAELLESELFGHEKGAFTGAHTEKPGKFELAHGGTIFLDEIGEMQTSLQAKLLQVLQDEEYYRVGGRRPVRVDARVVAATNCDLERAIAEGRFRADLYYRLNVVRLRVPPLRERPEDIEPLVRHFADHYGRRYLGHPLAVDPELLARFLVHPWPGNVRELENMVRRWVVLGDARTVIEDLDAGVEPRNATASPRLANEALGDGLKEIGRRAALAAEREAIRAALEQTGGNKRRAAERLRISYKALLYKMRDAGLEAPRAGEGDERVR